MFQLPGTQAYQVPYHSAAVVSEGRSIGYVARKRAEYSGAQDYLSHELIGTNPVPQLFPSHYHPNHPGHDGAIFAVGFVAPSSSLAATVYHIVHVLKHFSETVYRIGALAPVPPGADI